ncbi:MAG: DAK2 domain-containing protein [Candidatus Limnocylindrales bacterium]
MAAYYSIVQRPASTRDPRPERAAGTGDGAALLAAAIAATTHLAEHVGEVDALNVFPVPDGDTGTNMLATMRAAVDEAMSLPRDARDVERVAASLVLGALMGARGNSGVILSQILRGAATAISGEGRVDGHAMARGLRAASDAAAAAVAAPVEGTMLTVIRDVADAAGFAAGQDGRLAWVLAAAVRGADSSVTRTPMLLPILAEAGVVDAGGHGLFLLLEGTLRAVGGGDVQGATARVARPLQGAVAARAGDGYGLETTFLLRADRQPFDVAAVRQRLEAMGDSVGVAGDAAMLRIHIHSPDPEVVLAYGRSIGSVERVAIEDLDRQARAVHTASHTPARERRHGVGFVAVAQGEGLAHILEAAGATIVPARRRRPSAGELASAIRANGCDEVLLLPNDPNVALAADQATRLVDDIAVRVLPTRSAAEGIAAMLAADPRASAEVNVRQMGAAAGGITVVTITEASRDSRVQGRSVRRGEWLALGAHGALLAVGDDASDVAVAAVVDVAAAAELLTIYLGDGAGRDAGEALAAQLHAALSSAEVEILYGGQLHYRYLIAAE